MQRYLYDICRWFLLVMIITYMEQYNTFRIDSRNNCVFEMASNKSANSAGHILIVI